MVEALSYQWVDERKQLRQILCKIFILRGDFVTRSLNKHSSARVSRCLSQSPFLNLKYCKALWKDFKLVFIFLGNILLKVHPHSLFLFSFKMKLMVLALAQRNSFWNPKMRLVKLTSGLNNESFYDSSENSTVKY